MTRFGQLRLLFNEEGGDGGGGGGDGNTPPPAAGSILQTGGGGTETWYGTLPDELKGNPYVAQSKDLAGFVKSAIDTKSMVGANTIRLPGEKATPEERAEFYNKLGRPSDHTGYKPTVAPVEGVVDSAVNEQMTKKFHELGLTSQQGQAILDEYYGVLNGGFTTHNDNIIAQREQAMTTLKGEWGANYDANVKTAQLAVRELGGQELFEVLEGAGLADNPQIIKFLHNAGTKLLDDAAIGGGNNQFAGSIEGASAEIGRLKTDPEFMRVWGDAQAPGHKEAVDKWLALHRTAFPGKSED